MIDISHKLAKHTDLINWDHFDEVFEQAYHADKGRPGVSRRLMVGWHYLKSTFDMSDWDVLALWVENPYWQYFCGMNYFEHELPINSSSMMRWRKRIGEKGVEELLWETIDVGVWSGLINFSQVKRINVDTTVQEKVVSFPTEVRLYDLMRERLVKVVEAR